MTGAEDLARDWQRARPRLVRVAYSVLGSMTEAEDVVSDAWPRLIAADARDPVRDVEGWGIVAVARGSLDAYRSARRRRETYVGPWLPEPQLADPDAADPAERVTLDDTVSFALLVVLETLSPAERTSWVLHELFGMPFAEVAAVVGRTPAAVRQLASRARAHLRERAPRFPIDPLEHRQTVDRFLAAAAGGRIDDLLPVLDPDVVLTADGGGVVTAARRPVLGADRVARFVLGTMAKARHGDSARLLDVNACPGVGLYQQGRLTGVIALTVDGGRITRVDIVRAPGKLVAGPAPESGRTEETHDV